MERDYENTVVTNREFKILTRVKRGKSRCCASTELIPLFHLGLISPAKDETDEDGTPIFSGEYRLTKLGSRYYEFRREKKSLSIVTLVISVYGAIVATAAIVLGWLRPQ